MTLLPFGYRRAKGKKAIGTERRVRWFIRGGGVVVGEGALVERVGNFRVPWVMGWLINREVVRAGFVLSLCSCGCR